MVVDDEIDVTYTLRKMLEIEGHQADTFNDPTVALKNFKPHMYDLVLLDIRMPKLDGFELYRQIRKKDENARVYFMSAFEVHRDEFGRLPDASISCFMKKPLDQKEIKNMLNQIH